MKRFDADNRGRTPPPDANAKRWRKERCKAMTKAQEYAIDRIRRLVERHCKGVDLEVKQFEIDDCDYFISVSVVYGLPNDDGTLAQLLCRDRAHLFVGKRGGITYPVFGKRGGYRRKTFHGYSILEAVVDQRR